MTKLLESSKYDKKLTEIRVGVLNDEGKNQNIGKKWGGCLAKNWKKFKFRKKIGWSVSQRDIGKKSSSVP